MLTSKNRRKRPTPPPPDYARYRAMSMRVLIEEALAVLSDHDRIRIRGQTGRWCYAFVYDKFDEWGTIEVHKWCEARWSRSFEHEKNSKRHNANARWWAVNGEVILFSHEPEALEFKLRWV